MRYLALACQRDSFVADQRTDVHLILSRALSQRIQGGSFALPVRTAILAVGYGGASDPPWDPEKIYQAQRAGVFMRLVAAERMDGLDAERWIAGSEREAETVGRAPGSTGFWDDAWNWIEDQRSPPDAPKSNMSAERDDG